MIIGLTGGIATGKSAVAQHLRGLGATVIDADKVARDIVEPGTECLHVIASTFGNGILNDDGSLNRDKLGQMVMKDPKARSELEEITHPQIRAEIAQRVKEAVAAGAPAVFVEAALLIETGSASLYPHLWVVHCSRDTQVERLMARKGCDRSVAEEWVSSQMDMDEKVRHASRVIQNDGPLEDLHDKVLTAWSEIMEPRKDRG